MNVYLDLKLSSRSKPANINKVKDKARPAIASIVKVATQ